jgi:peptidyl-prolyl cis-trans isomerase B (cyclophilin B)
MIELQTSAGRITIELFEKEAPETCANFIRYVNAGFYDGTIFHRVIKKFMIQGGGFTEDMKQKSTQAPVKNEANNNISNKTGTIAMARTQDPHSATAQFFINVKDNNFLDHRSPTTQGWGYCVFGKVVDGLDIVHSIENVATGNRAGHGDVPLQAIVIQKASVIPG